LLIATAFISYNPETAESGNRHFGNNTGALAPLVQGQIRRNCTIVYQKNIQMINNSLKKDFNELKSKLESLYSDEGIKIKSKKDQIEVFVNKKAHSSNIVKILNKKVILLKVQKTILSFSKVWQLVLGKEYSNIKKMDKIMNSSSNNKKIK
jgi:hypothetical protein